MNFYRFPQVKQITGLSRSTIFRLEREGNFPKRRKLSQHSVAWLKNEIEDWILSRESVSTGGIK